MEKSEKPNDLDRELEGDEVNFPPGYTLDEDFASYFEKEMNNYLNNFRETFEFYRAPPDIKFVYKKEMKETSSELANAFKKGYDKVEDPCPNNQLNTHIYPLFVNKKVEESLEELKRAFNKAWGEAVKNGETTQQKLISGLETPLEVEDPCADGHERVDMIFSAFCKKCNKDL